MRDLYILCQRSLWTVTIITELMWWTDVMDSPLMQNKAHICESSAGSGRVRVIMHQKSEFPTTNYDYRSSKISSWFYYSTFIHLINNHILIKKFYPICTIPGRMRTRRLVARTCNASCHFGMEDMSLLIPFFILTPYRVCLRGILGPELYCLTMFFFTGSLGLVNSAEMSSKGGIG